MSEPTEPPGGPGSTSLRSEDVIAVAPHFRLQWEEAQQAHVLLYPEGMVQLSETAGEILGRCDGKASVAEIIAGVQALYPDDDVGEDVRSFLEEAASHGWIRARRAG